MNIYTGDQHNVSLTIAPRSIVPEVTSLLIFWGWAFTSPGRLAPSYPMLDLIKVLGDILRKHGVKFHMYADDTQIYIPFNPKIPGNSESALAKLKDCISEVQQWMLVNKLKLNQDKTEFLLIASPNHNRLLSNTRLVIVPNTVIHPSPFVRNLGVVFDKFMNMDEHVTQMCKSVNYHIHNLSRIRRYIDKDTCHTAVRALITSRLDYSNSLLNGITNKNMVRLQSLQNKAARLVYMTPKHTPTSPLIVKLHWLIIPQRIQYKILTIVFNSIHKEAPQYINELLHTYDMALGSGGAGGAAEPPEKNQGVRSTPWKFL